MSGTAAARDAGRDVQRVAEAASHRDVRQSLAVEHGANRRTVCIDDGRTRRDLNGLLHTADFHLQRKIDRLTEPHIDVVLLHRFEALQFDSYLVRAGYEQWHVESPVGVG